MATRRIHFISLGCPKNRVDSEVMLGVAQQRGLTHTADPADANVIVVNTCGFIDTAKKESIDTILEMASFKASGSCNTLVVAGCLSQRHPDEMARELPEVDHFLGSSDMLKLGDVLSGEAERVLVGNPADWLVNAQTPRAVSSSPASAYVKIAEGCNRSCSFCVIPQLRGKQRSRSIDDVVREVEQLAAGGVKELNLISQDTVAYGRDIAAGSRGASERGTLAELVERVADVPGIRWVRIFYLYPDKLSDRLIELLADHPHVLPYIDMPLQHAADGMLRRMKRGHGGERLRRVVERLRTAVTDLTFRTAFIVGHPGESEQEFKELCEFVTWAEFDRVGVFRYSDEDSCHSATMSDKVADEVADTRYHQLMEMCRRIAREKNSALVDRTLEVLVEGASDEHEAVLMGRHAGQAPDIDGQVYLSGTEYLARLPQPGELVGVRITQSSDYDLAGDVVRIDEVAAAPAARVRLRVLPSDNRELS
jgi:ribosomal protein S12 methylthiotransferase